MSRSTMPGWTAVIPVKAWTRAKTRLEAPDDARVEFARAVALDTVDTVAASQMVDRILVVTDEPTLTDVLTSLDRIVVLPEPRAASSDQLNHAIRVARDWASAHAPTSPIVVVPADLPALSTAGLDEAVEQLALFDRSHIPDHRGEGTTLSAAAQPSLLNPRYGPASERAHADSGSVPILGVQLGARLDVDTLEDVRGAVDLGVGRRTQTTDLCRQPVLVSGAVTE